LEFVTAANIDDECSSSCDKERAYLRDRHYVFVFFQKPYMEKGMESWQCRKATFGREHLAGDEWSEWLGNLQPIACLPQSFVVARQQQEVMSVDTRSSSSLKCFACMK